MKQCTKCFQRKPFDQFHRNRNTSDGYTHQCKDCACEAKKQYRQKHQHEIRESRKHYYRENPDKKREERKRWRERYPERWKDERRRWAKSNPQLKYAAIKRWRERNPEYFKQWRQENREKCRHYVASRRAAFLGAEGSHTLAEWLAVVAKHGGACAHCGCLGVKLTRDHIVPLTRGGSNFIDNIQPLCFSCNSKKGNKLEEELKRWKEERKAS